MDNSCERFQTTDYTEPFSAKLHDKVKEKAFTTVTTGLTEMTWQQVRLVPKHRFSLLLLLFVFLLLLFLLIPLISPLLFVLIFVLILIVLIRSHEDSQTSPHEVLSTIDFVG